MNLTEQINVRVDKDLKKDAEDILAKLGVRTTDAIRMFLKQIILTRSLPVELKLPNQTTINAINDSENGKLTNISNKDFDKLLDL